MSRAPSLPIAPALSGEGVRTGPHGPRERLVHRAARVVGLLAVTAAVAILATGVLELSQALHDPWRPWDTQMNGLPRQLLLLGVLLVWTLLVFLISLTGRLWVSSAIVLAGSLLVGFANHHKLRLRSESVYPSDVYHLHEPGLLVDTVGWSAVGLLALGGVGVVLAGYAAHRLSRRRARRRSPASAPLLTSRQRYVLRGVAGLLTGAVLMSAVSFHEPGNLVRRTYSAAGALWMPWDQRENFGHNGFVAGELYNMPAPAMDRPDGYDAATMQTLVSKYRRRAAAVNEARDPGALADTNVVLVLAESFTDPRQVPGVRLEVDPIPFTRSVMAATTSGQMLTPAYGGGTANVEFEVLTGMAMRNLRPQMSTPYQMLLPRFREFPSFVRTLAGSTHRTVAIHPFASSYYQREAVYPALGFEHVEFEDDMTYTYRLEDDQFVSDLATFRELVDELRSSDRPVVANVVTMQNHGPTRNKYSEPIQAWGPLDESMSSELEQYLRGLRYSDEAFEQLIEDLDGLGERTVVMMYGDHLPSGWPDRLLRTEPLVKYQTPFLVHANFEAGKVGTAPFLGPTFLVNQLLATVNAPVTPYHALLGEVAREIPVFEPTAILDAEGNELAEDDLSAEQRELLHDYRLVQYDLSVGERHSLEEMLEVPSAP